MREAGAMEQQLNNVNVTSLTQQLPENDRRAVDSAWRDPSGVAGDPVLAAVALKRLAKRERSFRRQGIGWLVFAAISSIPIGSTDLVLGLTGACGPDLRVRLGGSQSLS